VKPGGLGEWNDLQLIDWVRPAPIYDGSTFRGQHVLTQSLPGPYGSAIANPASAGTACTGVS
jgi:hypothetical protein